MPKREVQRERSGFPFVSIGIAAASLAITAGVTAAVITVIFARAVITPPSRRAEPLRIIAVTAHTVTLNATRDSTLAGKYSLWFGRDRGHARIGDILSMDDRHVTRRLESIDTGSLSVGMRGRIGGWYYRDPSDAGFPFEDVIIEADSGPAPAWLVRDDDSADLWMIGVHGRAVRRQEAIRALPVFRAEGFTCLLASYRNDGDAAPSPDNRYSLGDAEWRDIDSAIQFAVDHGARRIVLMGWSMGGAIVLQTLMRSKMSGYIVGVVLDSPVVDWIAALHFHGITHGLPKPMRLAAFSLLGRRWARAFTGQSDPIDLARLDIVHQADELEVPILLLHSDDDGYVPADASHALAQQRRDIVTFERFDSATHTKLWNFDPERWNGAIRRWLRMVSDAPPSSGQPVA